MTATYRRLVDPFAGARSYSVVRDGIDLGTVTNRRGGWWRATAVRFGKAHDAGSFHTTRAEATRALINAYDLAPAPVEAAPESPILRAALLDTGARVIAAERVRLAGEVRAGRVDPGDRATRLAAMVDTLVALLDVEEDVVVEAADDAFVAMVEA